MRLPQALVQEWRGEPDWLDALPGLVETLANEWDLELEEPFDTPHSLVIPAGDFVLKLNAPAHFEAEHEAEALDRWVGDGAVLLLGWDEARCALLLERCRPGRRLWDMTVDEPSVVAELLPRLSIRIRGRCPYRRVADEAARWADEVPHRCELGGRPFERELLDTAIDVFQTADANADYLVNQDLHGGNVLQAEREPWLVIDPKPLVGERELDGVGLLRNAAFADPAGASLRRWLDVLADLGLDRERARGWGVAHALAWGWSDEDGWIEEQVAAARAIACA